MLIAIDATTINANKHAGGKDEVVFNLFKGFQELGLAEHFIVYCREGAQELFRTYMPDAEYRTVKFRKYYGNKDKNDIINRGIIFRNVRKQCGADLLFFTNAMTGWLPCDTISCVNPHDIQFISYPERVTKKYAKFVRRHTKLDFYLRDYIFAISEYDRSEMLKYFPQHAHKIKVQYNPIKVLDDVQPARYKDLKYIVAVNPTYPHKNILTLLKAFRSIQDRVDYNLVVVGGYDNNKEKLMEYVLEHGMQRRVAFTGFVENQRLYEILAGASLYVNPSIFEGFGMTAVEAMILRIPTLVANVTASPETTMGLCHYYDDPYDWEKLGECMVGILQAERDEEQLRRISEIVRAQYDYKKIAREHYDFFVEVINKKRGAEA